MDAGPDSCALRSPGTGTFALTTKQSISNQTKKTCHGDASCFVTKNEHVARSGQFRKLVNSPQWPHRGLRVLQHTQSQVALQKQM